MYVRMYVVYVCYGIYVYFVRVSTLNNFLFLFLFLYALHRILLLSFSSINQPTNQPTFQKLLLYEVDQLSELVTTNNNSMNPLLYPFRYRMQVRTKALSSIYSLSVQARSNILIFSLETNRIAS